MNARAIDPLLEFLPRFEAPGFSPGEAVAQPGVMPWYRLAGAVMEFLVALGEHGWIARDFDWAAWQDTAAAYVANPGRLADADVETIRRLFTTHVRKDRFCDGHLVEMFANGHVAALLRRLAELRRQLDD